MKNLDNYFIVVNDRKAYISLIILINLMKQVFTISIDEKLVKKVREYSRDSYFRNKSHLVEEAIKRFLEDGK